jgi:hypothetical protein
MKAQMMKIAGYKNEKDFYKAFPDEASFRAKYGKELKQMQYGGDDLELYGGVVPFEGGLGGSQNPNQNYGDNNFNSQAPKAGFDFAGQLGAAGNVVEGLAGAFATAKQQKRTLQEAKQMNRVTDVQLAASRTRPEQIERKYVRPEDTMNTGEEFFPVYGVGSNPIDSAEYGGNIRKAQFGGITSTQMGQASGMASRGASALMKNDAGSQFGAVAGDAVGMIPGVGPIAKMVAKPLLTLAGGLIDRSAEKTKKFTDATGRNIAGMQGNQFGQAVQQQYSSFAENGTELPMYEEGGEYPMYASGGDMPSYENGGEYQTEWGGELEAVSHNPYSEGSGITYMANGNTHDESDGSGRTGIGVKVMGEGGHMEGGADVEVQDNEPISDGIVFGALRISKENAALLGDSKASGKSFQKYVDKLSKEEAKINKSSQKNFIEEGEASPRTSIEELKFNTRKAMAKGFDTQLQDIAVKKAKAGDLQSAINQEAEERGLDAFHLSKGHIRKANQLKDLSMALTYLKHKQV